VPDGEPIQATIVVGASGSRTILFSVPPTTGAHPELPAAEVIAGSRVLHIDYFGTTGNLRAIAIARRSGAGVVGDLEDDRDPRFAELLAAVDHPVLSRDFACRLTGAATPDEAATRLWAPGRSAVIVTDGANGCWSVEAGTPPIRHPTFAVTAVDTTGCGDVFHGVYAAALAAGLPLAQRIRRASAAAALKATRPGGQSGIPTAATLDAFLAAH
jgi:sugar/nucleoside kinase (ribokinase family)